MSRKAFGTVVGSVLALMLVGFVPGTRAVSERTQSTKFTFSQPVQLPGSRVLPGGSYWFEVPDAINAGHIVQVFNSDHSKVLATFQTITVERSTGGGGTELNVGKVAKGASMMIGWVYPGHRQGHEFVYSREKESQLSETGHVATVQIPTGRTVEIR